MKNIKKVAAVVLAAAVALTQIYAADGTDELYKASASAVDNDSVYFGDLLDWNLLMYPKMYGLVSIDSENKGNLGAAMNLKKGAQLHAFWDGNLWEENPENTVSVLYGKDKMAFEGEFLQTSYTEDLGGTNLDFTMKGLGAGFGYNVNKKFGFTVNLSGLWGDTNDIDLFTFNIGGGISYKLREDKAILSRVYAGWNGTFNNYSSKLIDTTTNVNIIYGSYKFQYKVGKDFTYGFVGTIPFIFNGGKDIDTTTTIAFNLKNGFVAKIKPTLNFAAGIETDLPSFVFYDGDKTTTDFKNTFFLGFGIEVTKSIELDVSANIKPTKDDDSGSDGESLDEIWKQTFAISVSFHL